jgi:hypothetical protein
MHGKKRQWHATWGAKSKKMDQETSGVVHLIDFFVEATRID